jgi:hypothetical protein
MCSSTRARASGSVPGHPPVTTRLSRRICLHQSPAQPVPSAGGRSASRARRCTPRGPRSGGGVAETEVASSDGSPLSTAVCSAPSIISTALTRYLAPAHCAPIALAGSFAERAAESSVARRGRYRNLAPSSREVAALTRPEVPLNRLRRRAARCSGTISGRGGESGGERPVMTGRGRALRVRAGRVRLGRTINVPSSGLETLRPLSRKPTLMRGYRPN